MADQLALDWTLDPTEAAVWRALSRRVGRVYAISRLALARELALDPRQLQKVVHRLRVQHGMPIGSGADQPNGYWILDSTEELEAFRQEQRRKALGTLLAVARACNATLPDLLGQIRMEYEEQAPAGSRHVRQALEATEGNQVRAARLLGISRDALRTRMKKFGFLPSVCNRPPI